MFYNPGGHDNKQEQRPFEILLAIVNHLLLIILKSGS